MVNEATLKIAYVDLDNVFVVDSMVYNRSDDRQPAISTWNQIHRHDMIDDCDNCFSYVPDELCSHHISDINIFAACQVFIKSTPNTEHAGLLHTIPDAVLDEFASLPNALDYCVKCPKTDCHNRFAVAKDLLTVFDIILDSSDEMNYNNDVI